MLQKASKKQKWPADLPLVFLLRLTEMTNFATNNMVCSTYLSEW